jgi:DNA polymerase (family 10)
VDRKQVAQTLAEVAALMKLAGENPFKVRAYENASHAILAFPGDLAEAVRTGRLRDVRGIGEAIFGHVRSLVMTGHLPLHEELRARFPPGLSDCLRLPGLGTSKIKLLHDALGIDSLETLEQACRDGRLAGVKGFGVKSAEKILRGIAALRAGAGYHRFHRALARADHLVEALGAAGARRVEIAGSLRRRREIVRDIDLVASSPDPQTLLAEFRVLPGVVESLGSEQDSTRVLLAEGIAADLYAVSEEEFGSALLLFTGSPEHVAGLQTRAAQHHFALGRRGLFRTGSGERLPAASEDRIYEALGLPWIPPELREGTGEIESAAGGRLPRLVEERDLRGLIHVHTTDSDGRDSLEDMVAAVCAAGYGYVAITDHSQSAAYARGLTQERALLQRARIRALSRRFPGLRLFHGTEADILADGSIDFGDEFLEGFDVVVASVHSRFGLPRQEQTRRLIAAVRNPRVSVLGHPSGRLLLSREPVSADMEAVLAAAAESGCAVEINGNPQRLDLDWRLCRKAVEAGVLLAIDPDAHSVAELDLVAYGVGIARKGWVTPSATLNAKDVAEFVDWLERRRGKPLPG